MSKLLPRVRRAAGAAVATVLLAAGGVAGLATPAQADEPGLWCTIASRGTITAPPTAQFGQFVPVQWNVQLNFCASPVVFVDGPGFGGGAEWQPATGSRQVRVTPAGTSVTWRLYLFDMQTDSQPVVELARWTTVVP